MPKFQWTNMLGSTSTGRAGRKWGCKPSHLSGNLLSLPFLTTHCKQGFAQSYSIAEGLSKQTQPISPSALNFNNQQGHCVQQLLLMQCGSMHRAPRVWLAVLEGEHIRELSTTSSWVTTGVDSLDLRPRCLYSRVCDALLKKSEVIFWNTQEETCAPWWKEFRGNDGSRRILLFKWESVIIIKSERHGQMGS